MRTTPALVLAASIAAALAAPTPASAQPYARGGSWRDSWYFGLGIGSGNGNYAIDDSRVNYRRAHGASGSPLNLAFQLELGATLTPHLLLGGEVNTLTSRLSTSNYDSTISVSQLLAVLTWFPVERGLFLRGGAGFASLSRHIDDGFVFADDSVNGVSILGGVGYAWWLGRRFNLTLHADASAQSYGSGSGVPTSSAGVNGYLGFRWY